MRLAQRAQDNRQVIGGVQGAGVVLAQDPALTAQGVLGPGRGPIREAGEMDELWMRSVATT
jgi:hypothetical protein